MLIPVIGIKGLSFDQSVLDALLKYESKHVIIQDLCIFVLSFLTDYEASKFTVRFHKKFVLETIVDNFFRLPLAKF